MSPLEPRPAVPPDVSDRGIHRSAWYYQVECFMHQIRIMQNGSGWYWEVVSQNREVIARGTAETHTQARADSARAVSRRMPAVSVGGAV